MSVRAAHPRASLDSGSMSLPDRLADWFTDRIFNDRELDHGLLMVVLGVWFGAMHGAMAMWWWADVFHVVPPWVWSATFCTVGASRLVASRFDRGVRLAHLAFIACLVYAFFGFLVVIVKWQATVTPIFFWLSYQSLKSHLRLMVQSRTMMDRRHKLHP